MPAVLAAEASRTAGVASRRIRPGRALRHIPVRAHARSRVRILVQVPVPTLLRGRDPGRDPIRQDRAQVRIRPVQAQVARFGSHPVAANSANDPTTLPAFDAVARYLMARP
ncbi:MAG TPA: hypothetical protein DCX91_05665 [Stenotrophomonas sp.]|nr:hypothetical protein [Stenotrophomonas sp.]